MTVKIFKIYYLGLSFQNTIKTITFWYCEEREM